MNQNKEWKDNVIRESVSVEKPVLTATAQAVAEGELSAPSSLPPIAKVLLIDGRVSATADGATDRMDVSGAVALSVLYTCAEGKVHGFESIAMFKHGCDMPDVRPGMRCDVNPSVDSLGHTFENGVLHVRAVINLQCAANDRVEASIVRRIDGNDVELKTMRLTAGHTHVETAEHSIREDARLPRPASKLLSCNGYARVQNISMENGLARVSGMLRLSVLFAALDGVPVQTPLSIPFEHAFPLPADAASAVAVAQILQLSTALMDEDIITVDAQLQIKLHVFIEQAVEAVSDAYSVQSPIAVSSSPIACPRSQATDLRCTVRAALPIPEGMPAPDRVLLAVARPSVATATAKDGAVLLEGTLQLSAVYADREGEPFGATAEVPFSCESDAPGIAAGMALSIRAACEANGTPAGSEIAMQCMLDAQAIASAEQNVSVVTGVGAGKPAVVELYGPVVYFPMPGETLWDVGKRFAVPQTELSRLNPEASTGSPGKVILLNLRRRAD